jgi:dihydroxyacetone kinase-like protein
MEKLTRAELPGLFASAAEMMAEKAEELGKMDALLGDGDLGLTMKKGFEALPALLQNLPEADVGLAIAKAGMTLSSTIPSTMGFLMGSGLMSGGKAVSGAGEIGAVEYAAFWRGFAEGIIKRGKCAPGDCTVLDAIDAAAVGAEEYLHKSPDASLAGAAAAARDGALAGVESTRQMIPKFGKAAVHQATSAGVIDQGAYAGYCLAAAFCRYVES